MLVAEEAVDPGLETAEEKHSRDRADARDAVRRYLRGEWPPHCERETRLKIDRKGAEIRVLLHSKW